MTTPVITSVTPYEATLSPGDSVVFTVVANDTNPSVGSLNLTVTDGQGNVSEPVTVPLTFLSPSTDLTLNVEAEGLPEGASVEVDGLTATVHF